jgi:hypothetical protein
MTERELLIQEFEQMTDEEIAKLSPEELDEIEAIIAAEPAQPQPAPAPQVNVEPGQIADIENGMDLAGQAAGQFLAASQAFPGVKQISAATELVTKAVQNPEDFAFDNIADHYSDIRKDQEAVYEKAKQDNPYTNIAGEIGAGLASFGAIGSAGKALTAGRAFGTAGFKSALTTTPAVTALQAYTRDSGVDMGEMAQEMGVATGLDMLLFGTGKAVTAAGRTLKRTADATPIEAIAARKTSILDVVDHIKGTADDVSPDAYRKSLKRFTDSIMDPKDPIVSIALDPDEMLEKAVKKYKEVGERVGNTYSKIDEIAPDIVNTKEVERTIRKEVIDPLLSAREPNRIKLGEKLLGELDQALYDTTTQIVENADGTVQRNISKVPHKFSMAELHRYFRDVSENASFSPGEVVTENVHKASKQYAQISGKLSGLMEDLVARAGDKVNDPNLIKQFKADKLLYRDLRTATKALADTAENYKASEGVSGLMSNIVSLKGITTAAAVGATIGEKTMIAPMAGMINALRSSRTMPATLGVASRKVADFLEAASMSPQSQQMVRQLSAAATISAVDFEKELTAQAAKADLLEQPLPRSVEAVIERSGPIRVLLNDIDPTVAADFEEILETGDEEQIAAYMNEIAALPEAQGLIEDGIGFNGKLYSPAEKEMMVNKVKSQRSLSRLDRLKIQKQIMEEGYIPSDEELEDRRQPKQWAPRDKNKLRY